MVTILPPATNLGTQIGQGLSQGLQRSNEINFNRGLLTKALGEAETSLNNPGATPASVLFSLLKGTAGIPGSERFVGPVYDALLRNMTFKNQGNIPPPGGLAAPGAGSTGPGGPSGPGNLPISGGTSFTPYQGYELPQPQQPIDIGTISPAAFGGGPVPKMYSPEEIREEGARLAKLGYDPAPIEERMRKYNQDTEAQFNAIAKGATTHNAIAEQNLSFQNAYRNLVNTQKPNLSEDDLSVFMNISNKPELKNMADADARYRAANKEFQAYEATRDSFIKDVNRFGSIFLPDRQQLDNLRAEAKELEKYGQTDKVYQYAREAGWGPRLTESLVSPMSRASQKIIDSLPKLPTIEKVTIQANQANPIQREKIIEGRDKLLKKWEEALPKILSPGKLNPNNKNYIEPGAPILGARAEFIESGGTWEEYRDMVNRGIKSGKIVLDPTQTRYQHYLNLPPFASLGIGEQLFQKLPAWLQPKVPL